MKILITNDDGIRASGLVHLVEAARQLGEVAIVAPDRERSACGHCMTMREPLRVKEFKWEGCQALEVNGFPTDCINVGLTLAWPNGCDLILSGINHGPNLGFDITYSGTVAGAMEGAINGIRSIAVSMVSFVLDGPLHFETGTFWLRQHLPSLVKAPLAPLTFLNVNIPAIHEAELRGQRVVPMGQRVYQDRVEMRNDPWGKPYYWQGGVAQLNSPQPGTDVEAVTEGFVSISPISLDWTSRGELDLLSKSLE